jgi:two-component system, OmpR family, sensor kinase
MRSRLFWKILFGFWLTFIAITQGVWMVMAFKDPARRPPRGEEVLELARTQLLLSSLALKTGGPAMFEHSKTGWRDHDLFSLGESQEAWTADDVPKIHEEDGFFVTTVTAPNQKIYSLRFDVARFRERNGGRGPFGIPHELVFMAVLGGLGFSAVLAWYLVQPIRRLRRGFGALAQGRLDTRLQGEVGRRRDEIADLAHDFDRMAERLEQLVESRDRLLHDVSHELRSPLARMQIAVALARQNPQKLEAMLDRIEAETARQDEMVGELLTLARLESGAQVLDTGFDLIELLRSVINDARFEADSSRVNIIAELPDRALPWTGRPELLRRAFENIIRNAIRFSPAGTAVHISQSRFDQCMQIEIRDAGPGVPDELLETMFEPFVRGKSDLSGFGLGLAIARRALEAHGGQLAASNAVAGGLIVMISLPVQAHA